MNLCINCRHHEARKISGPLTSFHHMDDLCHALDGTEHPVTGGKISRVLCDTMRLGAPCGLEGKLFSPSISTHRSDF
jgi:hypothetical protein